MSVAERCHIPALEGIQLIFTSMIQPNQEPWTDEPMGET